MKIINFLNAGVLAVVAMVAITAGAPAEEATDQIVDPEELDRDTTPPPSHVYDSWEDWETWEASPDIVKWFPYHRSGYDKDGRVVYVVDFGQWNYRELTHQPPEKIEEFWRFFEQYVRRIERDAALNGNQGIVLIFDWDSFSLRNYATADAIRLARKMFTSLVRVHKSTNYGFHVNASYAAETFLQSSKRFVGENYSKFQIYGPAQSDWKQKITEKIPANQLSPKYGGDDSWKSLPVNPTRR